MVHAVGTGEGFGELEALLWLEALIWLELRDEELFELLEDWNDEEFADSDEDDRDEDTTEEDDGSELEALLSISLCDELELTEEGASKLLDVRDDEDMEDWVLEGEAVPELPPQPTEIPHMIAIHT